MKRQRFSYFIELFWLHSNNIFKLFFKHLLLPLAIFSKALYFYIFLYIIYVYIYVFLVQMF